MTIIQRMSALFLQRPNRQMDEAAGATDCALRAVIEREQAELEARLVQTEVRLMQRDRSRDKDTT